MQRRLYNAVPQHVIERVFLKSRTTWQRLLEQGNIAQSSVQHLDKLRVILKEGLFTPHGPPLGSLKDDPHKEAYTLASGNALGPHKKYGDWKPLEELVASWKHIFGDEGELLCILAIWISGPPIIMHDEMLDLYNKGDLRIEPFRFYTAWGKYSCFLNMIMENVIVRKRLPEPGEASVFLWLPLQLQDKPKKWDKESPPVTKFDLERRADEKLLPDDRLYRFSMDPDTSGSFSPHNRRYGCKKDSVPPDWAAKELLEEEGRRKANPRDYNWRNHVTPEREAATQNSELLLRRTQRVTKAVLDQTRANLRQTRSDVENLRVEEMQTSLAQVLDTLPQYFQELFDTRCGTEGVEGTSVSDHELVRRNLSDREKAVSSLDQRRYFPANLLTEQQRIKAKQLLDLRDFASVKFWPAPGEERPRLAPQW